MSKHTSMVFTPYIIRMDELSSFLSLCCWLCILCVIVFIWIFAKETFSFWIFLFELMIFLQSEMPTLPPFKTTNIGPFFKILFSIIPTFRDFLQISQFEWIAPLSALKYGLPWWLSDQESSCQCRRRGFDSWVGEMAWTRKWQPTRVFLPGKSHYRGPWWATVHGVTKSWTQLSQWTTSAAIK